MSYTIVNGMLQLSSLKIDGDLDLSGSTELTSLPEGLTVGESLFLSDCTGLRSLPDDLSVGGSLHLNDCTGLTSLPKGLTVGGSLDISNCTELTSLPDRPKVSGSIDTRGCTKLKSKNTFDCTINIFSDNLSTNAIRETEKPKNHDDHYKKDGIESIQIMEEMIMNNIPTELKETVLRNFRAAMAMKYLIRLGLKDDPNKELDKAMNYIHRAKTGEWRK